MNTATETRRPHISDMENADIMALLDRHLFRHDVWCNGKSAFNAKANAYLCKECAQIDELADFVGGQAKHPRRIPDYSERQILAAMSMQRRAIRLRFLEFYMRLVLPVSPRVIAVEALRALGIIDGLGFLVDRGARHAK